MTLLDICEPLFQYMCRLNRSAKAGAALEPNTVRAEIRNLFDQIRARAASNPAHATQFERIELVLMGFVDFMIKEGSLAFARDWQELAYERNELAMDEKFFDLLDETLADPSESAAERLAVFYTCMGLGFSGWYSGQPEYLRKKMDECRARIGRRMEALESTRVCPDAYEGVDTRDLIEPPGKSLAAITIFLVGSIVVLFFVNIYMYHDGGSSLSRILKEIRGETAVESSDQASGWNTVDAPEVRA